MRLFGSLKFNIKHALFPAFVSIYCAKRLKEYNRKEFSVLFILKLFKLFFLSYILKCNDQRYNLL